MTLLQFELSRVNGRVRFFATNEPSKGILEACGRVCLTAAALGRLDAAGFVIRVNNGPIENVNWRTK